MKRYVNLFIILTIAIMFSQAAYARTYKIATVAWAGWSPINVAEAKNFFKEEGIDVKVVTTENPLQVMSLFKEKRVDLAFDMIGTIAGLYMDDLPITIIAETDWSHGGDKIILRSDKEASSVKGKIVGVYMNTPSLTYFLNLYFSGIGLKTSDVRITEMDMKTLADNFIAGRFDMMMGYDPDATRAVKDGKGKVVATSASYEGSLPEGIMVLNEVLKDIPKADLAKILKAWIKAVRWTQNPSNEKEYFSILNSHTFKGSPPYSEADLKQMLSEVRIHDVKAMSERNKTDGGLYKYLEDLKTFLSSNNLLKKEFKPSEIFDNTMIMEVLKEQQN